MLGRGLHLGRQGEGLVPHALPEMEAQGHPDTTVSGEEPAPADLPGLRRGSGGDAIRTPGDRPTGGPGAQVSGVLPEVAPDGGDDPVGEGDPEAGGDPAWGYLHADAIALGYTCKQRGRCGCGKHWDDYCRDMGIIGDRKLRAIRKHEVPLGEER